MRRIEADREKIVKDVSVQSYWSCTKQTLEKMSNIKDPKLDCEEQDSLFDQYIVRMLLEPRPKESTDCVLYRMALSVRRG